MFVGKKIEKFIGVIRSVRYSLFKLILILHLFWKILAFSTKNYYIVYNVNVSKK